MLKEPGANGPIVVWLFPSTTPGITGPLGAGRMDGVLAKGDITAADLVGPLRGLPLSELVTAINEGTAYVNVHTNDGVGSINTGRVISPMARFAASSACALINNQSRDTFQPPVVARRSNETDRRATFSANPLFRRAFQIAPEGYTLIGQWAKP